jgi:hypothetical protein
VDHSTPRRKRAYPVIRFRILYTTSNGAKHLGPVLTGRQCWANYLLVRARNWPGILSAELVREPDAA